MTPRETICAFHYTRSWPSGKSFVYTFGDAIVVISIPANYNTAKWLGCRPGRVWELSRLYAPDRHAPNLLTQAISYAVKQFHALGLADVLLSYADPNAGHSGGVYKAASWVPFGQSEESRTYRDAGGNIVPRRKFHSGKEFIKKAGILAKGYEEVKLPGKLRFLRWLTKTGRKAVLSHRSNATSLKSSLRAALRRNAAARERLTGLLIW